MKLIVKYFPGLTPQQLSRFSSLEGLYNEWNARVNLVSRKDIDSLYLHHVLHSLSIARLALFLPGARILDAGTGGGFPGIPLAIMFPDTSFVLADSIAKKTLAVSTIAADLGLDNVTVITKRVEEISGTFDFITARAVTRLPQMVSWVSKNIGPNSRHPIPNGLLCLKGGDLSEELTGIKENYSIYPVSDWFSEEYFVTKSLVHIFHRKN